MSRSNDPGHFFQTSSALGETARKAAKSKNTKGNPVKLPSKILAIAADPENEGQIYVAEAAGNVKRIVLETGEVSATYSGPAAPLTSIAISPRTKTLYAGCWDKTIWVWDTQTRKSGQRLQGHADFVKAILVLELQGKEVLVSGSADASIVVWDVTRGQKLHTLKGHARGILALAIDPLEYDDKKESAIVFSAGSDREIRRWRVGVDKAEEVRTEDGMSEAIVKHATSIDAIQFDSDGDLWTASADKTAKCLSRSHDWDADTSLEHPDFVRDIVVDEEGGWVVTACRDEEIRVWDKGSGKLHHTFSGHFEEVTGLLLLPDQKMASVSIDATVRQWSLKAPDLAKAVQEAKDERAGKEEETEPEKKEGLMTAEEEAELAELMEDGE